MTNSYDPIPVDAIGLRDAFRVFMKATTPTFAALEADLEYADACLYEAYIQCDPEDQRSAVAYKAIVGDWDTAVIDAELRFRKSLADGAIVALVREPETGKILKLQREGWQPDRWQPGGFLASDFVGEDDPVSRGPNTVVHGARRPVFFMQAEFELWLGVEAPAAKLINVFRSGVNGRPTSKHIILRHFRSRMAAGTVEDKIADEARVLHRWLEQKKLEERQYRDAPPVTAKNVTNMIREDFKRYHAERAENKTPA